MTDVLAALSLLTPYDINIPKIRLGPPSDGGYVFADIITADQKVISYGISTEYQFDEQMAIQGHPVYMFDHTINGIRQSSPNMRFFKEGVGGKDDDANHIYTITNHLRRHNITGNRLIMKMDVEGHEFDAILACDDTTLMRFEQMTIEFHWLSSLVDGTYRKKFVQTFEKINKYFTLFHVHANNYDGPTGFKFVDGLPVSDLVELSYIKTEIVDRSASRTLYPTALDFPNLPYPDKRLWFFPFLPTPLSTQDFILSWKRLSAAT